MKRADDPYAALLSPEAIEAGAWGPKPARGETPRYCAPKTGLHVVGFDDDEERSGHYNGPHISEVAASLSAPDAQRLFADLRKEFGEEDGDLIVDLVIDHSIEDNFYIRRQMLARVRAAIAEARKQQEK